MKVIFDLLLKFITWVVEFFMTVPNTLVANLLPDFSDMVSSWYNWVNQYLGAGLVYFFHYFPPTTRSLIITYLILLGSFYVVSTAVHFALKAVNIIKNVKIW